MLVGDPSKDKNPLTLDNDIPSLDGDLDPLGDFKKFLGVAVAQLSVHCPAM
jgi:hypothetical protein